jgi:hypothetical protein
MNIIIITHLSTSLNTVNLLEVIIVVKHFTVFFSYLLYYFIAICLLEWCPEVVKPDFSVSCAWFWSFQPYYTCFMKPKWSWIMFDTLPLLALINLNLFHHSYKVFTIKYIMFNLFVSVYGCYILQSLSSIS